LFLKIDEILRVYAEMSPKLISKSVVLSSCCWKIRSSILGSESTLNFGTSFTLRKTLYFSGIFLLYQKVTISQQTFGTFIVIIHGGPPDAGSASAVEKLEACFLGSQGPLLPLHPQRQGTILNDRRLVNKKILIIGTEPPLARNTT